jgi:uncharacterized membrane protein YciS (DUF1049 family)
LLNNAFAGCNVKYALIFLLILVIFIISVTFGAHNDQVITFNYLLAQGQYRLGSGPRLGDLRSVLLARTFLADARRTEDQTIGATASAS